MALLTEFIPWHVTSHIRNDSLCDELVATISARSYSEAAISREIPLFFR